MPNESRPAPAEAFRGLAILVVEDEALVSLLVEDALSELGAVVWIASRADEALKLLDRRVPDAAVLDVNLGGEMVFPVAERLEAAEIPIVFTTGYGRAGLPRRWQGRVILAKPFTPESLIQAVSAALA